MGKFEAPSVTSPTERIIARPDRPRDPTRAAGERISRAIGYNGPYPPR